MMGLQERLETIRATLRRFDQEHLLAFWSELSESSRDRLLSQLEGQNWEELDRLIDEHVRRPKGAPLPDPARIEPISYFPFVPDASQEPKYARAREVGIDQIRQGRVAAFTVAGGQGTRLGWDGPKGTYPATAIKNKPLFQLFAEYLLKVREKYGQHIPWYIMTSPLNHEDTRLFFEENSYFRLERDAVMFFEQGTMPSIGTDGRVLLAEKDSLALNPDGHGGSLRALERSGALKDMENRGIRLISYFQVDNPHVKCVDPLFLGLHVLEEAEASAKMLPKRAPEEKVGNLCLIDGRISVIEYSDMPKELAEARAPTGELKFNAGSIAIHVFSVDFVRRVNRECSQGRGLPFHRANKKVSFIDVASGGRVEPDSPNAVKLETFVFDALPLASRTVTLETNRIEEFAPIKNAQGADSPESSRRMQSFRAARWLGECGVQVPLHDDRVDAVIELSPLTAIEPRDLKRADLPEAVHEGERLYL